MNNRRGFLKLLGVGAVAAPLIPFVGKEDPVEEAAVDVALDLIDTPLSVKVRGNCSRKEIAKLLRRELRKPAFEHKLEYPKFIEPSDAHLTQAHTIKAASYGDTVGTDEGVKHVLDVAFNGGRVIRDWRMGLIDADNFTCLSATDTYSNLNQAGNGWNEFTKYTVDGRRKRPRVNFEPNGPRAIVTDKYQFDITSTGTVKGLFIIGGSCGFTDYCPGMTPEPNDKRCVLWSYALFNGGDICVGNGDQLKVNYHISV